MIESNTKARVLALVAIGICDALQEGRITVADAERILFSPHSMDVASHWDKRIVEVIHIGTELEDLIPSYPDDYRQSIVRMRELALEVLDNTHPCNTQEDHWIKLLE